MDRDLVISVDVGTTALKVAVWDASVQNSLVTHTEEYALEIGGDRVECDPQVYLDSVTRGIRAVIRDRSVARRIRSVCFTTQGETFILVDEGNRAVARAVVWLDARAEEEAAELRSLLDPEDFRRRTGLPSVVGALPLAKALHLARTRGGLLPPGGALLLLEDFLIAQLTGHRVSNASMQTSTGWFDIHTDDYWDDALRAAGLSRDDLPALVDSGAAVAPMLPGWTERLGLPADVVVVAGGMDQCVAALGAGAVDDGVVNITFGSALTVVGTLTEPPAEPGDSLTLYRHVLAGRYLALEFLPTGAILLSWVRRLLGRFSESEVEYEQLDALAADIPIGSDGVIALPQFEGDVAGVDSAAASGGFLGLTLATTPGHLVRSLMEATAYVLKEALARLAGHGVSIDALRTSGGGARSETWQRIVSDVCGHDLHRLRSEEATSRGAALLAHWGAGSIPFGTDPALPAVERISPHPGSALRYAAAERRYRAAVTSAREFWQATATTEPLVRTARSADERTPA